MQILGIETSCDETSAAIIKGNPRNSSITLLSNIVSSSVSLHKETGGIIPEIAAREQIKYIIPVIEEALRRAAPRDTRGTRGTFDTSSIDAIAVTIGPGLIGSLLVGVETAKALAYVWDKPIIPVNHLIGHIYANWIDSSPRHPELVSGSRSPQKEIADQVRNDKRISFPAIALIVSGGHTDLVLMKEHGSIKWLGGTRDDAAGEAFDKIGRLLGLPYPGGPAIEKISKEGNSNAYRLPRPMIDSEDFDFSFSGLKTAVFRHVILTLSEAKGKNLRSFGLRPQDDKVVRDISASVEQTIIDVLVTKTLKAAQKYKVSSILLAGGVAANELLRKTLEVRCQKLAVKFFAPAKNLCTDNAAMIASAAFFNYKPLPWQKITVNPELYFI